MAEAGKEATIEVTDDTLVTIELPEGLVLDEEVEGEAPPTLQDLKDAATAKPAVTEPKTPQEAVVQQRQPRKSAVSEAAEALSASQAATERERKARIAADQTAAAERARADEALRVANETAEQNRLLQERANSSDMAAITTAIDNAKTELASAKAAWITAHDAGDAAKMADASERIGNASADVKFNTLKKTDLEAAVQRATKTSHEGRVEVKPTGSPLDQYVARFSPRAQAWLRAHPECAPIPGGDPVKNSLMMVGHNEALQAGLTPDSDEYFAKIEERIGEAPVSAAAVTKKAGGEPADTAPAQRQQAPRQRQAQPSAPVSRDPPGPDGGAPVSRTVRLTPQQQEAALFSFPQNRGETDDAWKKRALGTYAREYIQARAEGKIGRLTH